MNGQGAIAGMDRHRRRFTFWPFCACQSGISASLILLLLRYACISGGCCGRRLMPWQEFVSGIINDFTWVGLLTLAVPKLTPVSITGLYQ